MLFWEEFFFTVIIEIFISFSLLNINYTNLLILSEFVIVLVYMMICFLALFYDLTWLFGFALNYILFASLELSLCFLLLIV